MSRRTDYVNDLSFEMPVDDGFESFEADVKVEIETYIYGDDADGNRGEERTDHFVEVIEVRNAEGKAVVCTPAMEGKICEVILEQGDFS